MHVDLIPGERRADLRLRSIPSLMALAREAARSGDYFEPQAEQGDEWAEQWVLGIDELLDDIGAELRHRNAMIQVASTCGMVKGQG